MAVHPFAIDSAAGVPSYGGADLRLGVLLPLLAGNGGVGSLAARSGVRLSGTGLELWVAAQTAPNMSVKVNTGAAIIQGGISTTQGPYGWSLDAAVTSTIAASHATLDRTDVVCVRLRDANVDTSGGRDASIVVITGTNGGGVPSLPTDATYLSLAQVFVQHAVTSIVTAAITDKRPFYAALGGVIPMVSTARATGNYAGDAAVELDTGFTYHWKSSATKWLRDQVFQSKSADQGFTNTTTPADVTDLAIAVEANAKYTFEFCIGITANSTIGLSTQISSPTGSRLDLGQLGIAYASGVVFIGWLQNAAATIGCGVYGQGPSNISCVRLAGTLATASTAGTFKLQAAQGAANASPSWVDQGSWLRIQQVA